MNQPLEPMYEAVKHDLGWSPQDMDPPFDLQAFIAASYARPTNVGSALATVVKTARKQVRPNA